MKTIYPFVIALAALLGVLSPQAYAGTAAEQLAAYISLAGAPAQVARGQQLFTSRHSKEWSCSTCHTSAPSVDGKHASTGKVIAPLAPAFNPERFTDMAKTEKWFRRNCNDVMGRECTSSEKADVLAWLLTLKR